MNFKNYISYVFWRCTETQRGCTALIRAAEAGSTDCVRLLLERGADTTAKENVRGSFSNHYSISSNSFYEFVKLIDVLVLCWVIFEKLSLFVCHIQRGYTAAAAAASNGNTDCLRLLMQSGADVHMKDSVRANTRK